MHPSPLINPKSVLDIIFKASSNYTITNPNAIKDTHILHINHAWFMKE